ncbi:MAG TPA: tol-pal system protein YbgF [Rhodocyclaceae bacterium]
MVGRFQLRSLSLVCLLAWVVPAHAALFDDSEARARIDKLRAELTAMQQAVDTATKNQLEFANQLEAMRADMAKLRGQLEVLGNDVDTTQKRQKDFYVDLDTRLRKLEPAAAAASAAAGADGSLPSGEATGSKTAVDENAATRDYEVALGFVRAGRYRDAVNAFAAFNRTHVGSVRQPNAHYWQASSHYQLREFTKAADQYARVVAGWPNDPKAPDAMLGQANAQFDAGDSKAGFRTLEALVQQYPKSSAAQTAQQRLKKKH